MHRALPLIAQIARVGVESLTPERTLDSLGLSSSLGLSILRSGLNRRLGCTLGALEWRMTIRELLAALDRAPLGTGASKAAPVTKPDLPRALGPLRGPRRSPWTQALPLHGVDIEDLASLPEWPLSDLQAGFYSEHFTAAELTYAQKQPDPRSTLGGCWCAKEAVKKCAPELLALPWRQIEVVHTSDGRPVVCLHDPQQAGAWEFVLSISHSATQAIASVLARRRV